MTLPLKGSRTIEVNGLVYRWKPTHRRGSPVVIAYAHIDTREGRSTLEVQVWERHASIITPSIMGSLIKHALVRGWNPKASGVFRIDPDTAAVML